MIDPSTMTSMLLVGLAAGVLSGMFGIGGGLVIVPALVIVMGLTQKAATGTSLFALLLPVGLLGVVEYYRRGDARLDYGLLLVPGLFFGAFLGARLTQDIPDLYLKRIYAGFLIVVACYYMYISTEKGRSRIYSKGEASRQAQGSR